MVRYLLLAVILWMKCEGADPAHAAKEAVNAKDYSKFMPNPTGHGFDDSGMTRDAEFSQDNQMGRFGIPDLNNPVTKELTDLDFEYAMQGERYLAVLFYSHAMKEYEYFALHWEKASMEMAESLKVFTSANITMARFDVSEPEHYEISERYHTGGPDQPSMQLFYNGKLLTSIKCPVAHHEIKQFIIAQTIPPVSELKNEANLRKWKRRKQYNQSNMKFLAYFSPEQTQEMEQFNNIAQRLRQKVQFAVVSDPTLFTIATKAEAPKPGSVVLFRDFDDVRQIEYKGQLKLPSLIQFLRQYNMPLLTNMGDTNEFRVRDLLGHPIPYRLLMFYKTEEQFEASRKHLETLAQEIRSEALVAYTIEQKDDGSNFDYTFWDVPGKEPAFLYIQIHKDRKYLYTGKDALEIKTVREFLKKVKSGDIEPKLKSQVEPVQNAGPVKVLVTTTYDKEVYDKTEKDSIVLFYYPNQRDSMWFMDQLVKFAKVWRREKRIDIFGVDCAQNDIMHVETPYLPMLFYVSAESKQEKIYLTNISIPIRYPDMEQLMQFVRNNTHFDLKQDQKVWDRVLEEDLKLKAEIKKQHQEETPPSAKDPVKEESESDDVLDDAMFGENFKKLKEKLLNGQDDEALEDIEDEEEYQGTAAERNMFPGSLSELQQAQNVIKSEINSLLKSTGFKIPDAFDEKFDAEKIKEAAIIPWYSGILLLLNVAMTAIFGDGLFGAVVVFVVLSTVFFGVPALRRMKRRSNMKSYLTKFYQKHDMKDQLKRISTLVDAYDQLDDGFKKLKEDLVRKYMMNEESKKTK